MALYNSIEISKVLEIKHSEILAIIHRFIREFNIYKNNSTSIFSPIMLEPSGEDKLKYVFDEFGAYIIGQALKYYGHKRILGSYISVMELDMNRKLQRDY